MQYLKDSLLNSIILLGSIVDLNQHDIDVSAALLKVFIRELPVPLIGLKFSESMGALPGKEDPV